MRRVLLALLALLLAVPAAQAGQRVYLNTQSLGQSLVTSPEVKAEVQSLRQTAVSKGSVKVIVGFQVPFGPEAALPRREQLAQRRDISAAATGLQSRFAGAVKRRPGSVRTYSALPFMALEVTPAELDKLTADPLVSSITENGSVPLLLEESAPQIRAPEAWSLGYTGRGQTVAIIDSGVDKTHPFLAGKVVAEACYSASFCPNGARSDTAPGSARPCGFTDCDHGTHVAGIVAGREQYFSGIAPDATLIAINVFSPSTTSPGSISAQWSDIIAGLNHVFELRNSYRIAAANVSIGGGKFSRSCDGFMPALTQAIANLRSAGIATVIASGNSGYSNGIAAPACVSSAVSVGAVSDADWGTCWGTPTAADKVACYSNSASILSLLAPGSAITSSVPGGGYDTWHGTSMAAPHVAGAFAVIRQMVPDASVGDVLAALRNSGRPVSDYRMKRRPVIKARIDVAAALTQFVTLHVAKAGEGAGEILITTPGGAAVCNGSCTMVIGTKVTMSAVPAMGSALASWSGPCSGTADCTFTVTGSTTVTASFGPVPIYTLTLNTAGTGSGSVSFAAPAGSVSCASTCTQSYSKGTMVKLTAAAAAGSRFKGWTGACKRRRACVIAMSDAMSVTATFSARR